MITSRTSTLHELQNKTQIKHLSLIETDRRKFIKKNIYKISLVEIDIIIENAYMHIHQSLHLGIDLLWEIGRRSGFEPCIFHLNNLPSLVPLSCHS